MRGYNTRGDAGRCCTKAQYHASNAWAGEGGMEVGDQVYTWVRPRWRDEIQRLTILKPQSHRIIRLLDRTIGCDLANVRPIGNVCYDLQNRSHSAIGLFCWWLVIVRLVVRMVARSTPIGENR